MTGLQRTSPAPSTVSSTVPSTGGKGRLSSIGQQRPGSVVCRNVWRRYPGAHNVPALGGVDLQVTPGEWLAIMGPSGSGKSTLLNLIGGLDTPDTGDIIVDGESMSGASRSGRAELRRMRVGIVLQSLNLLADLSVSQNVELPLRLAGQSRREARRGAAELLRDLGLEKLGDRMPDQLSGGQQQRVAIVRALANRPAVLLADEPTGALDRASASGVLDLLRAAHDMGQTLLVVTHDQRVASYADRVIMMEDGMIVESH
jgi:putative ABC transport system ATP-binding protein